MNGFLGSRPAPSPVPADFKLKELVQVGEILRAHQDMLDGRGDRDSETAEAVHDIGTSGIRAGVLVIRS